ncbi:MAG TPA: serine/threonine-protein kinase [Bryobacteraceae bacterium]|nr:serine/threonine-protein kinase [Bryobacteraceae bacterium]
MIGEILDGKYRIDRQLGAGGMGNVYLSTHLGTTRAVAVKVIAPRWANEAHFLARFQREAQACGRLRHPNIVNVTDFGIADTRRGRVPYLVMELLDGETLADFQRAQPRAPLLLVADLLDQVALALDEAHRNGIVHRDLKPENIWLEPNGRGGYSVKALDFGVAKMKSMGEPQSVPDQPAPQLEAVAPAFAGAEGETVAMDMASSSDASSGSFSSDPGQSMVGSLVGTPSFMSPEQALGFEIDFRSDIYSLAVVAYSLVCGALPFQGKSSELIEYHRNGAPRPPASTGDVPGDVSAAILAGLARDPNARPASATAFARRFHNAVDAEFFALRRSRAFLMQHFATYCFLLIPIWGMLLAVIALVAAFAVRPLPSGAPRSVALSLTAAALLVFSDNAMRAMASLIALDEQAGVRRLLAFRVFWRLIKATPTLVKTQAQSIFYFGRGWLIGDCLWPVVCVVEGLSGRNALLRSRALMAGLSSAGRALAIRHLALAVMSVTELLHSVSARAHRGPAQPESTAVWFPLFAVFAAAPLYLYDRTAAKKEGPLLRLDRTPEIRVTARPLSVSSMVWLALGALYLLYRWFADAYWSR